MRLEKGKRRMTMKKEKMEQRSGRRRR